MRMIHQRPSSIDMAPEVARGGNYNQSADIYSFSLILFEMMWGRVDLFAFSGIPLRTNHFTY